MKLSLRDKFKLFNLIRNPDMLEKLKKTELWVTVAGAALLSFFTQIGLDPELAAKLIAGIIGSYVGSRGLAKFGSAE